MASNVLFLREIIHRHSAVVIMTTLLTETICVVCNKERRTYLCDGCSKRFCRDHLDEHQKDLENGFDQLATDHDELRQMINDRKRYSIIKEIDQWEMDSINKIKQTADQYRERFLNLRNESIGVVESKLDDLAQQMKKMRQENEFNDLDLHQVKQRLNQLQNELIQLSNLSLRQQSTTLIHLVSIERFLRKYSYSGDLLPKEFDLDIRCKPFATTIAGGNGQGNRFDRSSSPLSIWRLIISIKLSTLLIGEMLVFSNEHRMLKSVEL